MPSFLRPVTFPTRTRNFSRALASHGMFSATASPRCEAAGACPILDRICSRRLVLSPQTACSSSLLQPVQRLSHRRLTEPTHPYLTIRIFPRQEHPRLLAPA